MGGIWNVYNFISVLLVIFGLFLILAGIFTAYFGSGKSRAVGAVLLIVGLIIGILVFMLTSQYGGSLAFMNEEVSLGDLMIETIGHIIATAIGVFAALGVFLLAIMKS